MLRAMVLGLDKKTWVIWLLALAGGVGAGYLVRRGSGDEGSWSLAGGQAGANSVAEEIWTGGEPVELERESLEDILANKSSTRLPRMTLWLLDASSEEIGELWRTLDERGGLKDMKTYDTIMVQWVEKDPRAALAEVRGKSLEKVAWWAWGRADPEVAFAAALQESPKHAANVLRSIGQFHLDVALRLMEEHPEAVAWVSVEGIGSGLAREDPRRAVEFLRSRGQAGGDELERWAREDPESALTWVKQNVSHHAESDRKKFLRKLVMQHPERVEGWLTKLPTGMMRRQMEMEYVGHLCETDLEQALAFAQGAKGLRSRVEMMAEVGARMKHQNPARSIELLGEMRLLLQVLSPEDRMNESATGEGKLDEWAKLLLAEDPVGVMEMMDEVEQVSTGGDRRAVIGVMKEWVRRDEVQFAEWLMEQEPGSMRDHGVVQLSNQLLAGGARSTDPGADYLSAHEWASSIGEKSTRDRQEQSVARGWMAGDPEGAEAFYRSLPEGDPARETFDRFRTP